LIIYSFFETFLFPFTLLSSRFIHVLWGCVDRSHRAERSCHVYHVAQRDPIYIDRASHLYILSCHLLLDSDSEDVSAISYALHFNVTNTKLDHFIGSR